MKHKAIFLFYQAILSDAAAVTPVTVALELWVSFLRSGLGDMTLLGVRALKALNLAQGDGKGMFSQFPQG